MAATIVVTCPKCKNHLKGPAEVQGRKVRCKSCGTIFTAQPEPPARGKAAPPERSKPVPPAKKAAAKSGRSDPKPSAAPPPPVDEAKNPYGLMDDDRAMEIMAKAQAMTPVPGITPTGSQGMNVDKNPYGVTTLDLTPRCPHCAKDMEEGDIICLHCGYNTMSRSHARTKRVHHTTSGDWIGWLGPAIACALAFLGLVGFSLWFDLSYAPSLAPDWSDDNIRGVRIWVPVVCAFPAWFALVFAVKRLIIHPRPPEIEKTK
ncbi:MAG TPA: hypothetical protein VFA18_03235 [Gemmataceae bacterium]|nr:hypothetical protein [Gemmataceae bacterium]